MNKKDTIGITDYIMELGLGKMIMALVIVAVVLTVMASIIPEITKALDETQSAQTNVTSEGVDFISSTSTSTILSMTTVIIIIGMLIGVMWVALKPLGLLSGDDDDPSLNYEGIDDDEEDDDDETIYIPDGNIRFEEEYARKVLRGKAKQKTKPKFKEKDYEGNKYEKTKFD